MRGIPLQTRKKTIEWRLGATVIQGLVQTNLDKHKHNITQPCQMNGPNTSRSNSSEKTVAQQPFRWQQEMISLGVHPLDKSAVDDC
jgi:hypothetical protein